MDEAQQKYTVGSINEQMKNATWIAQQLGVHRNSVINWRTGKTMPSLEDGLALAKLLNVPPGVLAKFCRVVRKRRLGVVDSVREAA